MILSFKPQFKDKIIAGTKIHTIRADNYKRWQKGRVMQLATGVRTKNYNQFDEKVCTGTQAIKFYFEDRILFTSVIIDGKELKYNELIKLVSNDGFDDLYSFLTWFKNTKAKPNEYFYEGKIIHWTDFRY